MEILEDRLMMDASKAAHLPYSLLVLHGHFQAGAATSVTFTDRQHQAISVIPTSVTARSVTVAVPFFLDAKSGQPTSSVANVAVFQGSKKAVATLKNLSVANLPRTGLPPGSLVLGLANAAQNAIDASIGNLAVIASIKPPGVTAPDSTRVVADLMALRAGIGLAEQALAPLASGAEARVDLGTFRGRPASLDASALAVMDRGIAAVVDDPSGRTPFARPLQGPALANKLEQLVLGALATGPRSILQGVGRVADVLSTGPGSKALPAGALVTGLTLGYTSAIVASAAAESGTIVFGGDPQQQRIDVLQVGGALGGPVLGQDVGAIASGFVPGSPIGQGLLAEAFVAADLATQLNPGVPGSFGSQYLAALPALDNFLRNGHP
jgi:hypothetical protein